jgi:hypothetical protein
MSVSSIRNGNNGNKDEKGGTTSIKNKIKETG